jgi:hypothetical protein
MLFVVGDRIRWQHAVPESNAKNALGIITAVIPNETGVDEFTLYEIKFDFGTFTPLRRKDRTRTAVKSKLRPTKSRLSGFHFSYLQSSSLTLFASSGSTVVDLGNLRLGFTTLAAAEFSDTMQFTKAVLTATLDQTDLTRPLLGSGNSVALGFPD